MQAQAALKDIMLEKEFGAAGDEVVIEELCVLSTCLVAASVRLLELQHMPYNS